MKRRFFLMALLLVMSSGLFMAHAQCSQDCLPHAENEGRTLVRVMEVDGRQGIASDGESYYVSGSTALYKYRKGGELVRSDIDPFRSLELSANHIGDIDVCNGEIYAGIETFIDGVGQNIQVAVYDAETLEWKRSIPWNPASGQVEVCGLAVDKAHGRVWMADWVQGTHLYCYDLKTGEYVGKVALDPAPGLQQGIVCNGGNIIISCDDGDAEKNLPDHLYVCEIYPSGSSVLPEQVRPELYRTMSDFCRTGEIEGLSIDPITGELIVLANRGARIILGMPSGFYPGYDREIHELYIYGPECICNKH